MIYREENWHKGDRCPVCGSKFLFREIVYKDRISSENGLEQEIDIQSNNVVKKRYYCTQCDALLFEAPSNKEVMKE